MCDLMDFLASGKYKSLLELGKQLELLKLRIRHYQEMIGEVRMEWSEHSVVGKFINFRKFEYDEAGLKGFLDELGLLPVVSLVNWKYLTSEEQACLDLDKIPRTQTLHFVPNQANRITIDELDEFIQAIDKLEINKLVRQWKEKKVKYKELKEIWNWISQNTLQINPKCEQYKQYGTVSMRQVDPKLNAVQTFNILGRETFRKRCKIEDDSLISYSLKGYYSLKEARQYRTLIDIESRYYLLQTCEEARMREMCQNRLRRYSMITPLE
jgi:hypothetical protein